MIHRFGTAVLGSTAGILPPEVVSSAEIEARLAPVYERLRLPTGRLELMTGIRERRFWPIGFRPSVAAAEAGAAALARAPEAARARIGLLIHAGVCRDFLEPATAAFVHRRLGLGPRVQAFDLSNACLGFLNGLVLASGLIEAGQIESALVVTAENGRPLLEETLVRLQSGDLDRQQIKPYFANLTIGAGAVAAVVCHRDLAPGQPRLAGAAIRAETAHSDLCTGDTAGAGGLQMQTEAEELLEAGLAAAAATWAEFPAAAGWGGADPDRTICHQVGRTHRRRLLEVLGLRAETDYVTYDRLGNAGSASCPLSLVLAAEEGFVRSGQKVALLGIGSGINCLFLGLEW